MQKITFVCNAQRIVNFVNKTILKEIFYNVLSVSKDIKFMLANV